MSIADCCERGCKDNTLDSRIASSAQYTERSLARRYDQLILVLGNSPGEGRRRVQYVVATIDRGLPARVRFEVCHEERDAVILQLRSQLACACRAPDSGANSMAGGQQLQEGVARNEARASGYQHRAHRSLRPWVLSPVRFIRSLGECIAGIARIARIAHMASSD